MLWPGEGSRPAYSNSGDGRLISGTDMMEDPWRTLLI